MLYSLLMPTFSILSAIPHPAKTEIISVEADTHPGFHSFNIIGLGDRSLKEAKERVTSAIKNSGLKPKHFYTKKLTVLLAPGDVKKEGTYFDLSIALSVLGAHGIYTTNSKHWLCIGELSLDGKIKECHKIIPVLRHIQNLNQNIKVIIPLANKYLVKDLELDKDKNVFYAGTLVDALNIITGSVLSQVYDNTRERLKINEEETTNESAIPEIIGNNQAKRALLIAQAGNHHICLYGPSGTGKSSLGKWAKLCALDLTKDEQVETLHNRSFIDHCFDLNSYKKQPFVSISHEIPKQRLLGGNNYLIGEVSLAHNGILFMDEFIEFNPQIIRSLRGILETGKSVVYSNKVSYEVNAKLLLIAATNLCPCGNFGSKTMHCNCKEDIRHKYTHRIPGAIIDRIPIWTLVENEGSYTHTIQIKSTHGLNNVNEGDFNFNDYKKKLLSTVNFRNQRINNEEKNREVLIKRDNHEKEIISNISQEIKENNAIKISHRSFKNLISVARTIADIEQSEQIMREHVYEALGFRPTIFNAQ